MILYYFLLITGQLKNIIDIIEYILKDTHLCNEVRFDYTQVHISVIGN